MPGRINDEDIRLLREQADLGAIIADHTSLKRAGGRLKGLCPFHGEKTPSFTVDPAKNLWHCFGCGEGGDVYGFVQQAEALSFPEAVERVARLSGYTLRYEELSPGQRKALGRRTRLAEAVEAAAAFYAEQLHGPAGADARGYLASRGLDQSAAERFRLGWAPDEWDALVRHLTGAGFDQGELVDAGLVSAGRQGGIDRFRGRVVFPIFERSGKDVVAFGGRVLPGVELRTGPRDGTPPKYINSPETELYRKSEILYGLNWARAALQRRDAALVVEGYMDVIGLHLAGIEHAVATCGTALTADHFRQLERFARRVILALDADDAGYAAADRARALAADAGVREVGVLPLPAGKDPADLAADGAEAVEQALEQVQTAVEFQVEHLLRDADIATPEAQVDTYRRTFPLLARLDDRFLRYTYIRDIVAPAVRLPADRIEAELDQHIAEQGQQPDTGAPEAPAPVTRLGGLSPAATRNPQVWLERQVLQAALQTPELLPPSWALVTEDDFTTGASRMLFAAVREAPEGRLDAVLAALPDDDARARVRALALAERAFEATEHTIGELVGDLRAASLRRRCDELRGELATLRPDAEPERFRALQATLMELERARHDLLEGSHA